jgi:hypothetical protein
MGEKNEAHEEQLGFSDYVRYTQEREGRKDTRGSILQLVKRAGERLSPRL